MIVQVIFFALISLASLNLLNSKRVICDVINLQLERLKDTIEIERESYIVTKLARKSTLKVEEPFLQAIGEDNKQELGYVATYVSAEFQKTYISDSDCKLEDLFFCEY